MTALSSRVDLQHSHRGGGGAARSQAGLHSLALPFYHHEFVRRAVLTACEEPLASPALLTLLKSLTASRDLSMSQVRWRCKKIAWLKPRFNRAPL
jgi:hypothetical protein